MLMTMVGGMNVYVKTEMTGECNGSMHSANSYTTSRNVARYHNSNRANSSSSDGKVNLF